MKISLAILASLLLLTSCATPLTSAGTAGTLTLAKETSVVNSNAPVRKTGKLCLHNILGIVVFGDTSTRAIKDELGIKNISSIDNDAFGILGLYARSCAIVKGS